MTNKLRIRAKSLNLDLVGDPEYIMRAYDAIHPVLVERFEESVEGVLDDAVGEHRSAHPTIPIHRAVKDEQVQDADDEEARHLNVVVCNDVYNKIYLVDRGAVSLTRFDQVVDIEQVNRVYVNRSQRDSFRGFFRRGKVLWRELTTVGKSVVKGS